MICCRKSFVRISGTLEDLIALTVLIVQTPKIKSFFVADKKDGMDDVFLAMMECSCYLVRK